MINKHWNYSSSDLINALIEAGLPHSRRTLWLWEKKGKLVSPKLPSGRRAYTKQIIQKIIKAFSPGGKGFYRYSPRGENHE